MDIVEISSMTPSQQRSMRTDCKPYSQETFAPNCARLPSEGPDFLQVHLYADRRCLHLCIDELQSRFMERQHSTDVAKVGFDIYPVGAYQKRGFTPKVTRKTHKIYTPEPRTFHHTDSATRANETTFAKKAFKIHLLTRKKMTFVVPHLPG